MFRAHSGFIFSILSWYHFFLFCKLQFAFLFLSFFFFFVLGHDTCYNALVSVARVCCRGRLGLGLYTVRDIMGGAVGCSVLSNHQAHVSYVFTLSTPLFGPCSLMGLFMFTWWWQRRAVIV